MANKHTILGVFKDELQFYTWSHALKWRDVDVIPAILSKEAADETHPYVGDVLARCKEQGIRLDGILLHDSSRPKGDPYLQFLHQGWQDTEKQMAQVDAEMERYRFTIHATSDDPVQASIRQAEAQRIADESHAQAVERIKDQLRKKKQAAEHLLLNNPPSDKGIEFIKMLRHDISPYKDIPIVVGFAHIDKKEAFLKAGATVVKTTFDPTDEAGLDALHEAIKDHQANMLLANGPKTPLGHARRPREDQGPPNFP